MRSLKRSLGTSVLPRMRPDKALQARSLVRRVGLTPATAYALAAIRYPDRIAIIDELGQLTFAQVHRRTSAIAQGLRSAGVDHRHTIAILCRNHRGLIEATVACSRLAANVVYLDPATTRSALADKVRRADPRALIYDEEFSDLVRGMARGRQRFIAWCGPDRHARYPQLAELIERESGADASWPRARGNATVTLADDLMGRPARTLPNSLLIPGAVMSKIPLRRRGTTLIAAPLCGTWGFVHFALGLRLASTLVLQRTFDPSAALSAVDAHEVAALAVLPEMLEEIMDLPVASSRCHDTRSLRVIAVQGPGLASELALPAIERFGDVLYNLQGSIVIHLDEDWVHQTSVTERAAERIAVLR